MIEDKLSVKAICQLTGINEHTLRAWERRYNVVTPKRLDNGRRVYSIEDLEKLKLIILLIRKGCLIGNLAKHSVAELSNLLSEAAQTPNMADSAAQQQSRSEQLKVSLDEAISRYELIKINVLLQQAKAEFSVREYLFQVLIPLMVRVGEAVFHKEFSIGQEHALSAVVKYHLLQVFYLLSNSRAVLGETEAPKTFALATSENNQHEFGLLAAAVLCALQGYAVFYLGTSMPADSLAEAAEAVGANCVILGLPPIEGQNSINTQYIERLLYALPKTCELWTGGSSDYHTPTYDVGRLRHLPSLDELDRLLMNLKQI